MCRNEEKAQNAIDRLNKTTPGQSNNLVFVKFDLTDIPSAKAAAEAIQAQTSRLDILVNNAGIMAWPYEVKNGVEIQFVSVVPFRIRRTPSDLETRSLTLALCPQSNHVGHFALTTKLLPLMIQTSKEPGSSVRIVNVSSKGAKPSSAGRVGGSRRSSAFLLRSPRVQSEARLL